MKSLESVALDQKRWSLTDLKLKRNLEMARYQIIGLCITGVLLASLAAQLHASYPVASEVAGYAAAVALGLVVLVRSQGLRSKNVQAWVVTTAAAQLLRSEMYRYRTSSGPYSDSLPGSPDETLLKRRDEILQKVRPIQAYTVEPDPKTVVPLGPMDADAYISERVNGAISFRQNAADHFVSAQSSWEKLENLLAIAGAILAAALTFTHSQAYVWVVVLMTMGAAIGADTLAERYAQLTIGYRALPDRLNSIVDRWRANHGTLDQLVDQVEMILLEETQSWVAGPDALLNDTGSSLVKISGSQPVLQSPATRSAHLN